MAIRYDLHTHSSFSDGTDLPTQIVRLAAKEGLQMLALTDHDTMAGVEEAVRAGKEYGVAVVPAVEMDTQWPHELHILGIDVDPDHPELREMLRLAADRRAHRNERMLIQLRQAGYDISAHLVTGPGNVTRLHFAQALAAAGYAPSMQKAFEQYLQPGKPGYFEEQKFDPGEVIGTINKANGLAVLAHPCHIRSNPHALIRDLCMMGLAGIEAYYPSSKPEQTQTYASLAAQYRLMVTCGSDFHGANRPTRLGCTWRDTPSLVRTGEILCKRMSKQANG